MRILLLVVVGASIAWGDLGAGSLGDGSADAAKLAERGQSPVIWTAVAAGDWGAPSDPALGEQLAELRRQCAALGRDEPKAHDRARAVHELLFERIQRCGFRRQEVNPAAALRTGHFNCLTSCIWLLELAPIARLEVRAVERPGHLFCIFRDDDAADRREQTGRCRWVAWEPTCSDWQAACGGTSFQPAAGERILGLPEVMAKVCCNRSLAERQHERHFSTATAIGPDDAQRPSRERLGREPGPPRAASLAAWHWAICAVVLDPGCPVGQANLRGLMNNEAVRLAAAGHGGLARSVWAAGACAWPSDPVFRLNLERSTAPR